MQRGLGRPTDSDPDRLGIRPAVPDRDAAEPDPDPHRPEPDPDPHRPEPDPDPQRTGDPQRFRYPE
ncbi:hypothetical protein [Nocardioides sp. Soil805]|uniref:hypothetical protein n=1 Tax=Nocardioides sp. Soil805 TaxID=1736416 RepID=UPI00070325FF|nr:hypothetical protein [Nocardioides sp. Soil805]KRF29407.1 hypothetical protein ASG94_20710 [Nocardioides sp. Soil805]